MVELTFYNFMKKIIELTIEVHCNNCNSNISGNKVPLKCPGCKNIMDYIRILKTNNDELIT